MIKTIKYQDNNFVTVLLDDEIIKADENLAEMIKYSYFYDREPYDGWEMKYSEFHIHYYQKLWNAIKHGAYKQ